MRATLVMRKKSAIMASAIAAIITTSILAFALPNQVFAQCPWGPPPTGHAWQVPPVPNTGGQGGKVLAGQEAQAGYYYKQLATKLCPKIHHLL